MKRKNYRPGKPASVEARADGNRWTLVFVRELRHPPAKVWQALTDPRELAKWAPFDPDRDLGTPGPAALTMAGGSAPEPPLPSTVVRAEAPKLLEYTWGEDLLRWELAPTASGTRLTLSHTMGDRTWLPKTAAGWQICLDVAEQALSGESIGRIVAGEAKDYGWEQLNADYAEQLGIENTGFPADDQKPS